MRTCLWKSEVWTISCEWSIKLLKDCLIRLLCPSLVLNQLLTGRQFSFFFIIKTTKVDLNIPSRLQVIFLEARVRFFQTRLVKSLLILSLGVLLNMVLLNAGQCATAIRVIHRPIIHLVEIVVTRARLRQLSRLIVWSQRLVVCANHSRDDIGPIKLLLFKTLPDWVVQFGIGSRFFEFIKFGLCPLCFF